MNKLIEAEVSRLVAETSEHHDWTIKDREMTVQALHRFEKALREDILSKLPDVRVQKNSMLPEGFVKDATPEMKADQLLMDGSFNSCLSQVKNIISGV